MATNQSLIIAALYLFWCAAYKLRKQATATLTLALMSLVRAKTGEAVLWESEAPRETAGGRTAGS
jgi:hypothetical protein